MFFQHAVGHGLCLFFNASGSRNLQIGRSILLLLLLEDTSMLLVWYVDVTCIEPRLGVRRSVKLEALNCFMLAGRNVMSCPWIKGVL